MAAKVREHGCIRKIVLSTINERCLHGTDCKIVNHLEEHPAFHISTCCIRCQSRHERDQDYKPGSILLAVRQMLESSLP
jgi:hypothetical protein